MSDTTWQTVNVTVQVEVPDDDNAASHAEAVVKAALLSSTSIRQATVHRAVSLIDR